MYRRSAPNSSTLFYYRSPQAKRTLSARNGRLGRKLSAHLTSSTSPNAPFFFFSCQYLLRRVARLQRQQRCKRFHAVRFPGSSLLFDDAQYNEQSNSYTYNAGHLITFNATESTNQNTPVRGAMTWNFADRLCEGLDDFRAM